MRTPDFGQRNPEPGVFFAVFMSRHCMNQKIFGDVSQGISLFPICPRRTPIEFPETFRKVALGREA